MIRRSLVLLATTAITTGCARDWVESRSGLAEADVDGLRVIEALDLEGRSAPVEAAEGDADADEDARIEGLRAMLADLDPRTFDVGLDEFRVSLLENNLELEVSRFDPQIAATRVESEYGRLDATFGLSTTFAQEVQDASENNLPDLALESGYDEAEATLDVPLATGGSIELSADLYRYETQYLADPPVPGLTGDPTVAYPSNLSAEVTLPILRGAGYEANLGSIAIAAYDQRISQVELRSMMTELLASSERVYWQLVRSWRSAKISVELLELARQQVLDTEKLAEAGVVPASQRYRARLTVDQRKAAVFESELDLRRDMRSVKVIMNRPDLPLDSGRIVRPVTAPLLRSFVLDKAVLATLAIDNRAEIMKAALQLEQDDVRAAVARNALLPKLDFSGEVGALGIGLDGAGDSIASLFDGEYPVTWSIGLDFSVPIGNRTAEANYQSAVIGRLQTLSRQRELSLAIAQDVYDSVDRLELTWARLLTHRRAREDAERNLEATRMLFRSGGATALDVALAISDVGDARMAVLDSEITYQIAIIDLAAATGTTLGRQGVEVLDRRRRSSTQDSTEPRSTESRSEPPPASVLESPRRPR